MNFLRGNEKHMNLERVLNAMDFNGFGMGLE